MEFEWNALKNERNIIKHGIDFSDVIRFFNGPCLDWLSSYPDETRWVRVLAMNQSLIAVVYTIRGPKIRLISARKARDNEKRAYRELFER